MLITETANYGHNKFYDTGPGAVDLLVLTAFNTDTKYLFFTKQPFYEEVNHTESIIFKTTSVSASLCISIQGILTEGVQGSVQLTSLY